MTSGLIREVALLTGFLSPLIIPDFINTPCLWEVRGNKECSLLVLAAEAHDKVLTSVQVTMRNSWGQRSNNNNNPN